VLVPSLVLYAFPFGSLDLAERHLLAIFMAMVLGLVLRPAPPGMIASRCRSAKSSDPKGKA
jgi:hypothetical protein